MPPMRLAVSVLVGMIGLGASVGTARGDEEPRTAPTPAPAPPPYVVALPPSPASPAPTVYVGTVDHSLAVSDRASAHPFTAGLDVYFGPGSLPSDAPSVVFAPSLQLAYTPAPHVTVGANNISAAFRAAPDGAKTAFSAGPFAEVYSFVGGTTQWYGQLGIPVQIRPGASADPVGFAPYAGLGVRFWVAPTFSLGLGTRLHVAGSRYYQLGNAVLAQGDVAWTSGLNFDFHF